MGAGGKPNRNERRKQKTRDVLLGAADTVFRRKGVDKATVNDITEEADVAYGTFYNYFRTIDDMVSACAELAIQKVADYTDDILRHADKVELLPCIGSRVVMRVLIRDPAIRWMVDRPHVFVEEMYKVAAPFQRRAEADAVADGRLKPVGGHEWWLKNFPWLLLAELHEALKDDDTVVHEDRFAAVSLRFLGVDDGRAISLIKESRKLVDQFGLPTSAAPAETLGK